MAVDRSEVAQTVFFENNRRHDHVFCAFLGQSAESQQRVAAGNTTEKRFEIVVDAVVDRIRDQLVEIARHRADVACDGPLVVVEDDDQPSGGVSEVVERLHRDAASESGIAEQRDDVLGAAAQVARRAMPSAADSAVPAWPAP